jgi:hypothetical protein
MLLALEPENPMIIYFLQKKNGMEKSKKNKNIELLVLIIVCLGILIGVALFAA